MGQLLIQGILSSQIDNAWPRVESLIRGVLKEEKDYGTDDIKDRCKDKRMQLWVIGDFDGFVITTITVYPLRKVLITMFAAGEDGCVDWIKVMDYLKTFAVNKGCSAVRIYGRRGWIKKFNPKNKDMAFFDLEVAL